jgi:hypothetical protein
MKYERKRDGEGKYFCALKIQINWRGVFCESGGYVGLGKRPAGRLYLRLSEARRMGRKRRRGGE